MWYGVAGILTILLAYHQSDEAMRQSLILGLLPFVGALAMVFFVIWFCDDPPRVKEWSRRMDEKRKKIRSMR